MKKLILSLMSAMLGCAAFAASCVTATQLSTNYTTQTVTFKLTWTNCNAVTNHLNKVWCFVDFRTGDANGGKGVWTRATISGTPNVANGTYSAGNTTGFYVTGTNGQSATVTVKLGNVPVLFDWCAFATDYPPNVTYTAANRGTFKGTAPFYVTYADNTVETFAAKDNQPLAAKTIKSVTDHTSCPGIVNCGITQNNPSAATICYRYTNTFNLAAVTIIGGTGYYQWQQSSDNTTWTNAAGASANAAYTTPQLTGDMYYRRTITTSCGNAATSTAAKVTVIDASTYTGAGFQIKIGDWGTGVYTTSTGAAAGCPNGWRRPNLNEMRTIAANKDKISPPCGWKYSSYWTTYYWGRCSSPNCYCYVYWLSAYSYVDIGSNTGWMDCANAAKGIICIK